MGMVALVLKHETQIVCSTVLPVRGVAVAEQLLLYQQACVQQAMLFHSLSAECTPSPRQLPCLACWSCQVPVHVHTPTEPLHDKS